VHVNCCIPFTTCRGRLSDLDTVFARGIGETADWGVEGEGGKRVVYAVPSAPSNCSKQQATLLVSWVGDM